MNGLCRLMSALALLALGGCLAHRPPEIGIGLPHTVTDLQRAFDERVRLRYPVGSSETVLLADMRREHFAVIQHTDPSSRYRTKADLTYSSFPCRVFWTIDWNSADATITDIRDEYGQTCL